VKCNVGNSQYVKHFLDSQHPFGQLENTVEVIKIMPKGSIMDMYDYSYIYKCNKNTELVNGQYINMSNIDQFWKMIQCWQ
jgi:hypothetical protein